MKETHRKRLHGTCVEVEGLGVLLRGPTASGKSDLALRLIDRGALLIADDFTELSREKNDLIARAPKAIRDLLEVRGVGILKIGGTRQTKLGVIFDLVTHQQVERQPEDRGEKILGIQIPLFNLVPIEASSAAKVRLVVRHITGEITTST